MSAKTFSGFRIFSAAASLTVLATVGAATPGHGAGKVQPEVKQHASSIDDPLQWPASSVGKVTVLWGNNAIVECTGTLIGPKLVLTAAHCLHSGSGLAKAPMVHFVLGMNKGQVSAHSLAESFILAPLHSMDEPFSSDYAKTDWALVTLKDPLAAKPIPVAALSLAQLTKIATDKSAFEIGYGQERRYLPTVAKNCRILEPDDSGIFGHDCLFNFGYSGAPLLAEVDGATSVIGVSSLNLSSAGVATAGVACSATQFAGPVKQMLTQPAAVSAQDPKPKPKTAAKP